MREPEQLELPFPEKVGATQALKDIQGWCFRYLAGESVVTADALVTDIEARIARALKESRRVEHLNQRAGSESDVPVRGNGRDEGIRGRAGGDDVRRCGPA